MKATAIAQTINESGQTYCGHKAKGWDGESVSRVYFGSDYVTIESDGEIHNRRSGKARAMTIGWTAVEMVEAVLEVA